MAFVRESLWKEAAETYYRGAEAYSRCNDYLMQSEASVSYTHLDVYKRQLLDSFESSREFLWLF